MKRAIGSVLAGIVVLLLYAAPDLFPNKMVGFGLAVLVFGLVALLEGPEPAGWRYAAWAAVGVGGSSLILGLLI